MGLHIPERRAGPEDVLVMPWSPVYPERIEGLGPRVVTEERGLCSAFDCLTRTGTTYSGMRLCDRHARERAIRAKYERGNR